MNLEIVSKFVGRHDDSICYFFKFRIEQLGASQGFGHEVDWQLLLVTFDFPFKDEDYTDGRS